MQYSHKLSNKHSASYMKWYSRLKKLGVSSSMLDTFIDEEFSVTADNSKNYKNYRFSDSDLTVANLYEYTDAHRVIKGLKRLARQYYDSSFFGAKLDPETLENRYRKHIAESHDIDNMLLGSIKLKGSKLGEYFDYASFYLTSISNSFFMVHIIFHFNDDTKKRLMKDRVSCTTRRYITLNMLLATADDFRIWPNVSDETQWWSDYFTSINQIATDTRLFVNEQLARPLATVFGTITFYETKRTAAQVSTDFTKLQVAFYGMENNFEKLYIDYYADCNYIRLFDKKDIEKAIPGNPEYPRRYADDFEPFFFYRAFELYAAQIKSEVYKIITEVATIPLWKRIFKPRLLSRKSATLALMKYHLTNMQQLLNGYVWSRYVILNQHNNGSIKRFNHYMGNNSYNHSKDTDEWLKLELSTIEKLLKSASDRVDDELGAKNTRSNTRLTWTIVIATLIGVAVASITLIATLYPNTVRHRVCDRKLYCSYLDK